MRGNPFAFASDMVSGRPHVVARSLYAFPKDVDFPPEKRGASVITPIGPWETLPEVVQRLATL